jgi:D-3-phosphoglycerate dehydrogenase
MAKYTVLIEARPFCASDNAPLQKLKDSGIGMIDFRGSGIENSDFIDALKQADAILCGNELCVNDQLFARAPRVAAIAKLGVGLDNVDIDAASRHGAIVFNTPGANNQAVADHTLALILSLARNIRYCDQSLRQKRWEHTQIMGVEIWQKTIGIIGLGVIGRCVALRAKGFGMRIVAHDLFWPSEFADEQGIEKVSLDKLLRVSDIVTIHVPLTAVNKGMINAQTLKLMKPTALLINTARGGIVREADLYQALKNGELAGAGIDVFEQEPPTESPLLELDNVGMGIVDQLIALSQGQKPEHTLNPEVFEGHKK